MEKLICLLVLIPFLISKTCFGDVIVVNVHFVEKCVKITNVDDYPDVALLGYPHPGAMNYDTYFISSSECLIKSYTYNDFYIFAINKEYLTGKDIKKIDLPKDPNALPSNIHIIPNGDYVNDSIPISGIEQYYKIAGFSSTSVIFYKWKEITKFNNGKPDSTSTYTYDGDLSKLYQNLQVGIHSNQYPASIELYPNPAQKIVHLKINNAYQGKVTLEMTTLGGKTVRYLNLVKAGLILDYDIHIENLAKETYLVNLRFGPRVESRKIIIK